MTYTLFFCTFFLLYLILCLIINLLIVMSKKFVFNRAKLLKKAKWAIYKAHWFNSFLPWEYHVFLVNPNCCSKYYLLSFIQNNQLSPEAELLLYENYGKESPSLLKNYIQHQGIQQPLLLKIIKDKELNLFKYYLGFKTNLHYVHETILSNEAQIALINTNDPAFVQKALEYGVRFTYAAFAALLQLGNYDILEMYCKNCLQLNSNSFCDDYWFGILAERNDIKSLSLLSCYFMLSYKALLKLVEAEQDEFLKDYFQRANISESIQCSIAQSENKKLVALYLKAKPFVKKAQIAFIKSNYKDLMKYYYDHYGFDDDVITYWAAFQQFKAFLDV